MAVSGLSKVESTKVLNLTIQLIALARNIWNMLLLSSYSYRTLQALMN